MSLADRAMTSITEFTLSGSRSLSSIASFRKKRKPVKAKEMARAVHR